jgi:hypothetical protein
MGNTPSSVEVQYHQRAPHKLSKPRVGNAAGGGAGLGASVSMPGLLSSSLMIPSSGTATTSSTAPSAGGGHNSNAARFSTFRPAPPPDLHPYAPAPSTIAHSAAGFGAAAAGAPVDPSLVDPRSSSADLNRMAAAMGGGGGMGGTRERIRRSLFRSRSSQGREAVADDGSVTPRERRLSVGPRDPVTGNRLSRTNSLAAEHEGYATYMGRPATEDK